MPPDEEFERRLRARNKAWNRYSHAQEYLKAAGRECKQQISDLQSEVDRLLREHDNNFANAEDAHEESRRAYRRGDHEGARSHADLRDMLRAELPELVAQRRHLIEQLRAAREAYNVAIDSLRRKRVRYMRARHALDAYLNTPSQATLRLADVPPEYHGNALLRHNLDDSYDIYFGGAGEPTGPGHGHYYYDASGQLVYQRDPGKPHGLHNFKVKQTGESPEPSVG